MTWVVWRQYRLQWAIALALLAAFAAVLLINGVQVAHAWHSLLTNCARDPQANNDGCAQQNIVSTFGNQLRNISEMVPGLFGIFWGAPLLAHEIETGTTTFAWTQGITRARWLWVKVGWLLLAAALWGGAVAALVTWWSGPVNAQQGNTFLVNNFDTQGIAPIGYSVFSMALGIAAGALLRRTLPAIAVALAGFVVVRLVIAEEIRQHLMPAVTIIISMTSNWSPPGISWILQTGLVNKAGQVLGGGSNGPTFSNGAFSASISGFPAACQKIVNGPPATSTGNAINDCLARYGYRELISYQPGHRFWPIQGIETGIYLLVAAVLLAIAWYVIRRRDA
jgi:hypothetical protein